MHPHQREERRDDLPASHGRVRSSNAPAATTNANAWLMPPVDSVPLNDASSPAASARHQG